MNRGGAGRRPRRRLRFDPLAQQNGTPQSTACLSSAEEAYQSFSKDREMTIFWISLVPS